MDIRELAEKHLREKLLPFWEKLKDEENGGFYGYMDFDLNVDKKSVKGCILNSRILWFFSNAAMILKDPSLLAYADHAYQFMVEHCLDKGNGGIYWSINFDGSPADTTKHTYNQAFAIYALSSYYDATKRQEAIAEAIKLMEIIETKCTDEIGYLEAFDRGFSPVENDKLSENGVIAEKTMNTLLHVFEAYTELYRVSRDEKTADRMRFMLDTIAEKVYNPVLGRQEVFFDKDWNSLIDLYSYGHDIEAAWLTDRGLEILQDDGYTEKLAPVTDTITNNIYQRAFAGHSLPNEAENGVADTTRVWWVQAEAIVGFVNAWQKHPQEQKWLDAAGEVWEYIRTRLIDQREGSEWFWSVQADGTPNEKPIVEPWKCPYHNGRMCMEVIRRLGQS